MVIRQCNRCGHDLTPREAYIFRGRFYCDDCHMTVRDVQGRKTHWQYLSSIKGGYLIPVGKAPEKDGGG